MRRRLTLDRSQVFEGPLVLVNPSHPIRREGLVELVPADPGYPRVLLERRTAGLLQACLQSIRARGAIVPVSGWRSRQEQQEIWDDTLRRQGEAFTRNYVALPGCSEHQTGLAIDLGRAAREIDFIRPDFPEEGACGRFRRLAPRYGFIQRYHREKESLTGIACEPWHYRYVGTPHALLMEREGLCLEEYLDWVQTAPRTCRLEHGRSARVFYMPCAGDETELRLPEGCCQVSGDNRNGFVVTVWEV